MIPAEFRDSGYIAFLRSAKQKASAHYQELSFENSATV